MARRLASHPAKENVQAHIDLDVYKHALSVYRYAQTVFASFSHFMDSVVALNERVFSESNTSVAVANMKELKVRHFMSLSTMEAFPKTKALHLCMDPRAKKFIDSLLAKYPVLFRNRNECLTLCLLYVLQFEHGPERSSYLIRRLKASAESFAKAEL